MQRILINGIGAILLLTTASFINPLPGLLYSWTINRAVAQSPEKQQTLKLFLAAEKQVLIKDEQGKQKITWQALNNKAIVKPGDILRYTLTGENTSDRPLKNLNLNQPIAKGMVYILKSANFPSDVKVSYSIDGGRSFVVNPTIKVTLPNGNIQTQPAPASAYTHIRFYSPVIAANTTLKVTYQTQVR
ncbi:DUF11 domain-containing protein [Nostoc sp. FACHB-280]|uniref:DUF11 domain-containing protein n=1 Tax=Nostoc sp. FACHB-280 TaxID=2692839 RepID=UPI00168AA914|nr:DUF11 domain-containing protein [Nostoc sp. FACHB-280]MBD2492994.1 DUF11 domain-containing protein [Nostoc sp. FACHB-280]